MPNLNVPITNSKLALNYISQINNFVELDSFTPLIPCYLCDELDLEDFKESLQKNIFIGAKLYPVNVTTNSSKGVSNINNIFPALEILEESSKYLLIHGEKTGENIDIFDREKLFIDDELTIIRKKFPNLKIILEHVSSKYGADFVFENNNIAGTITPQHMLITKKDVFKNNNINPFNYCMPVVKEENDLVALRKYACSGNNKFFLGTDSAPHDISKKNVIKSKVLPGIFSSPCSIELYAEIFEQEKALHNLELFSSINGAKFYDMPINKKMINIVKQKWILEEFTTDNGVKIKNFFGGSELNWKVVL